MDKMTPNGNGSKRWYDDHIKVIVGGMIITTILVVSGPLWLLLNMKVNAHAGNDAATYETIQAHNRDIDRVEHRFDEVIAGQVRIEASIHAIQEELP
jgi:hypothetical protein